MKFTKFGTDFQIDEGLIEEEEEEIGRQLEQYFSGSREAFNLEVSFPDNFTGDVMQEMAKIPYGETRTYGELASPEKERVPENPPVLPVATGTEALDSSAVAVGQACGRNPVPLIVPCHRVVGKGSVGGYAYGEKVKEKLLELEK